MKNYELILLITPTILALNMVASMDNTKGAI